MRSMLRSRGWPAWAGLAGPLVGRDRDVAGCCRLLRQPDVRLGTLVGPGGVGKTALAAAVGDLLIPDFPDGVFFVDLAPLRDAALVPDAIGRAVGLRESGSERLAVSVLRYLRDRELLLVLDNFEHVLAAAAQVVEGLAACPGVTALATSRAPLGVPGERELPVAPLPVPLLGAPSAVVAGVPSVVLFTRRAQAVRPDFAVTPENAATVGEICLRLDGLPLAVELAAARVKVLGPEQILARLRDRFRLLAAPNRLAPDRHRSLRRAVDWSYGLLSDTERALFRALSVFAGGWELEAAEAVCSGWRTGTVHIRPDDVVDLLGRLVDCSVVVAEESTGRVRYRLLETLRQYAADRLAEAGEQARFRERHRSWYQALAEQAAAGIASPGEAGWLDRLAADHDNLRAALEYSETADDVEPGLRLAGSLFRFWDVRGYLGEGTDRLRRLLARPGAAAPTTGRAAALNCLGTLALARADQALAHAALAESAEVGAQLGEVRLEVWPLTMAAFRAFLGTDNVQGAALAERSHALALAAADEVMLIRTYCACGLFRFAAGDRAEGAALLEQSLRIARRLGSTWGTANVLYLTGWTAWQSGDNERAEDLEREALGLLWSLGDRRTVPDVLDVLACVATAADRPERAVGLFGLSARLREDTGGGRPPYIGPDCERAIGRARHELGRERFDRIWAARTAQSVPAAIAEVLAAEDRPVAASPLLTPREAQIVPLVAIGRTNAQIAAALHISERTADRHLENLRTKLGVRTRAEIAAWAGRTESERAALPV